MFGKYGLTQFNNIKERFNISEAANHKSNPQIYPGEVAPVIVKIERERKILMMKWSPSSYSCDDLKKTIRAQKSTLQAKNPNYEILRDSFKTKRCLVPANFYYESLKIRKGGTPYLIKLVDQELFAFAGLWFETHEADENEFLTFVIIKTEPNDLVFKIDDDMPVILRPQDEERWLNPKTPKKELIELLKPYTPEKMTIIPINE